MLLSAVKLSPDKGNGDRIPSQGFSYRSPGDTASRCSKDLELGQHLGLLTNE